MEAGRVSTVVVAIDGPSGSGKSSVAREVARRLDLAYLDTGAMYRAATWWCLHSGVPLEDQPAVARAVRELPLDQGVDPDAPHVVVAGTDVGEAIRATAISAAVSAVATNLDVRDELRRRQRTAIAAQRDPGAFSGGRGIVAEGRDITTVVAPDADVRILLTASEEARLARRARDVHGSDDEAAVAATRDQVLRRDADDSTVVQFQVAADGVVTVDSSDLDLEQTVQAVLAVVTQVTGR
ncbi:(d)CMP kinase [Cellulomonas sp. DKR-3]|uniref:Cytidylate kinase n=1 Tax=Cellulomonas fulva TaxID=2835530 RepID=A0ABS5U0Z6_9CELL|nr:(d)CMP kinase [Cellulomonas fulva]MBT0995080.1 (d)CMP kinase [Cellulomonas fulva]